MASSIFEISFKNFTFLTQFMKNYAILEVSTKKKIICDTGSINMPIQAKKAYRFTDFQILHHNYIIMILWSRFSNSIKQLL